MKNQKFAEQMLAAYGNGHVAFADAEQLNEEGDYERSLDLTLSKDSVLIAMVNDNMPNLILPPGSTFEVLSYVGGRKGLRTGKQVNGEAITFDASEIKAIEFFQRVEIVDSQASGKDSQVTK